MDFDFQEYIKKMEEQAKNNDVGEYFVRRIGVSLDESSYVAVTALKNVYVELETVTKNAQKNAERLEKKRQERELKNLKNSYDLYMITEQEYYEKLKTYRDENVKKGSDLWYEITDDIIQYNKKLWKAVLEEQEKAVKEQQKLEKEQKKLQNDQLEFLEKLDSVKEKLNEKVESLKFDFVNKMEEIEQGLADNLRSLEEEWVESKKIRFIGMNKNGTDLVYFSDKINNFEKEIDILKRFYSVAVKLKNMEIFPDEFFAEMAKTDPEEATRIMEKLLTAGDEKRKAFVEGYELKNALADKIAQDLNGFLNKTAIEDVKDQTDAAIKELMVETEKEKESFVGQLEKYFGEVPEQYYSLGEDTASFFGEGFKATLEKTLEESRSILMESANSFGEDFSLKLKEFSDSIYGNGANVYNNSFNFNAAKDTITQQLAKIKAATVLEKLRGGR